MLSLRSKSIIPLILLLIIFTSSAFSFLNKDKTKVLLIGLDGADWKVIHPLVKEGKLPNIKLLMDRGCWGKLENFDPLISERIWTSIATGRVPEAHGVTDRLFEDPDTGETIPCTSNLRKVKAIWNILSEHKKKVGVIGYKVTWPPEEVNGVMISDRADMGQYLFKDYSYPPFTDLCSEIEFNSFSEIKDSIFSWIYEQIYQEKDAHFHWSAICGVLEQDNFMSNVAKYLLEERNFDFFSLYILGTDSVSHLFWKYLFPVPEGFEVNEGDRIRFKDIINGYYIYCDRVIGELLKKIDKDTVVIIVSDHGFGVGEYRGFILNINSLLEICGLNKIEKNSKIIVLKNDPEDTFGTKQNIKIIGNLSKQEFNEVREEAKEILQNIKVKETDDYIFERTTNTKEGFVLFKIDMSYTEEEPSYHILIQDKEYKLSDFLIEDPICGNHDSLGVIIIYGKNISRNKVIETATTYDITPTILYLMGLPVGKDMNGKILFEAIDKRFLKIQPVEYIETYETEKKEKPQKPIRRPSDEQEIIERMRSLGYID